MEKAGAQDVRRQRQAWSRGLEDGAIRSAGRRRSGVRDGLVDHLDARLLVRPEPEHTQMRPVHLVDGLDGVGVPVRGDEAEVADVLDALGQRGDRRGPAGVEVVGLGDELSVLVLEHRHVPKVVRGETEELPKGVHLGLAEELGGADPAHRDPLDLGDICVLVVAEHELGDPDDAGCAVDVRLLLAGIDGDQAHVGDADVGPDLLQLDHALEVSRPAGDVHREDLVPLLIREQERGLLDLLDELVPVANRLEFTLGQNRDLHLLSSPSPSRRCVVSPHLAALHRYAAELRRTIQKSS